MPNQPTNQDRFLHPKFWLIWIGYGVARVILLLPYTWLINIGKGLGWLMHNYASKRRHVVEVNVRLAFPELDEKQQADFVVSTFSANGIGFIESLLAWWGPKSSLLERVTFDGLEHLKAAEAKGQGVLLVAAHFSTLEMGGLFIGQQTTMDAIYRRHDNPLMEHLITKGRLRFCNQVIERRDLRAVLRNLRKNHCIWYAPDQDMGMDTSVFVPFFGHQAATLTATSRLAGLNNSPVIICAYHREDGGCYRVSFSPALDEFPSSDAKVDAERINSLLEECIRRHPEQYLWLHKRYKTQPEGRDTLYDF